MRSVLRYLRYSGLWIGLVVNPWHWSWGWITTDTQPFENQLKLGPIWIRIIIDDGRW